MKRRHQKDISDAQGRPHQVVVLEKQQNEEKKVHMRILKTCQTSKMERFAKMFNG